MAAQGEKQVGKLGEKLVEARGLTKVYANGIVAVRDLDLNVYRGEVYGFLGPNGAGKTTTLRMLVGLIRPSSGGAVVAGHPPGSPAGLARVGAIIETPAFYPYLSGYDNLQIVAGLAGVPTSRIGPALEEVELTPRAKHKFDTYSMGMKQRLGVAATLIKEPELLVLDEPTNGLDPQGMADMRRLIIGLGKGERTVLISSHLLDEVEQMCTRIGVIQHGSLVSEGTMEEIRGATALLVRAEPAEKARQVLDDLLGADRVTASDGSFRLKVELDRTADINRRLVEAGVAVTELRPSQRSLEEVFMELTGEKGGL
jgi:ABC-type multidrug transport system ATPase subunit